MAAMRVDLQYGTDGLAFETHAENVRVLAPRFIPGLRDEQRSFVDAVRRPIGTDPLKEHIRKGDQVAIVIADITRPLHSDRLLTWLLQELNYVPDEQFVILVGNGSHRACTPAELERLVGADVLSRIKVVNHDAYDPAAMADAGAGFDGKPVLLNRRWVEADRRIAIGFIEPHLMAGFSGGYKAVFPGITSIDNIMAYHGSDVVADPASTWGRLENNPTQERIRRNGSRAPVDFLLNVTLNKERQITAFFCGDVLEAHSKGCAFAKETAMVACAKPFDVIVTTNSGYPLDQNLYQSVKGMSAAAQVIKPGGYIATAARCNEGFPEHGNFKRLLFDANSAQEVLETVTEPDHSVFDQWEAQLLANILVKARVGLYSELEAQDVRRAHLEPIIDLAAAVRTALGEVGEGARLAILPEGPQTIPYLQD